MIVSNKDAEMNQVLKMNCDGNDGNDGNGKDGKRMIFFRHRPHGPPPGG